MPPKDARSSPPIAMRIVRPYGTEGELLAHESSAFTRTGVVLIGAPSRPNGVVLRFEIALKDGTPVMRGEGRVVGFKPPMANEEGALMLRFTRLDVKSKSLLDRAVAMREERRSLAPPPQRPASALAPQPTPQPTAAHKPATPLPSPPAAARSVRPPLPSVAPVASGPPSTPAIPIPDDDPDEAQEVEDADIESAEPTVLDADAAAVAPVVSVTTIDADVDDLLAAPVVKTEAAPPPKHETPRPPEHVPPPHVAPERAPPPQRSPEPARRLDSNTRESALERLRSRAKKLAEMPSYFPVGERSSAPNQPDVTKTSIDPSHTPALGSLVAEREK